MFNFLKKRDYESELVSLIKSFDILNERYKQKTISLEEFTKQCDIITKKITKCGKKLNNNN